MCLQSLHARFPKSGHRPIGFPILRLCPTELLLFASCSFHGWVLQFRFSSPTFVLCLLEPLETCSSRNKAKCASNCSETSPPSSRMGCLKKKNSLRSSRSSSALRATSTCRGLWERRTEGARLPHRGLGGPRAGGKWRDIIRRTRLSPLHLVLSLQASLSLSLPLLCPVRSIHFTNVLAWGLKLV